MVHKIETVIPEISEKKAKVQEVFAHDESHFLNLSLSVVRMIDRLSLL